MTGLNEISIDELVKRIEMRIGSHDLISDDLFSQLRTRHRLLMDVVEAATSVLRNARMTDPASERLLTQLAEKVNEIIWTDPTETGR